MTVDGDTLFKYYSADSLVYHSAPCHQHVHLGKLAKYSIRAYTGLGNPPGNTLDSSLKIGFCLVDGDQYQQDTCCGPVHGTRPVRFFTTCAADISSSFYEGISVGWQDTYGYWLDDQWINISHIQSSGRYWLQSVVDPDKFIRQASQFNDTARIPIFVVYKDLYEPNDSKAAVDLMPLGGAYSSNLKTCQTVVDNLTVHREYPQDAPCNHLVSTGDVDYFKIYLPSMGASTHYVRIRFTDLSGTAFKDGDLALELRNSNDQIVTLQDDPSNDDEEISLNGKAAGTYYVKVYGHPKLDVVANSNYYYRLELSLPACGDVNGDGVITIADVIALTSCCGSPTGCNGGNVPCFSNADVNGDGVVNCTDRDIIYAYVFYGVALPCP